MLKVGECPEQCEYKDMFHRISKEKNEFIEEIKELEREHEDIRRQLNDGIDAKQKAKLLEEINEYEAVKRERKQVEELKARIVVLDSERTKLAQRVEKIQQEKNEILSATELDIRVQNLKKSKEGYENELVKRKTEFVKYTNAIQILNSQVGALNVEKRNLTEHYNAMIEKVQFAEQQLNVQNKLISQYRKELGLLSKSRIKSINNVPPHIKSKKWYQFWKRKPVIQQHYYDNLDVDLAVAKLTGQNRGGDNATETKTSQVQMPVL